MKLTFLGTGTSQGVPVIACRCNVCRSSDERDTRLRTSALLTVGNNNILFDVVIKLEEISNCLVGFSKDKISIDGCSCILPNEIKERL